MITSINFIYHFM